MAFKDRLKKCREDRGISQMTLADALGLSIGGIGGYENGSRFPKPDILAKIAEYFNVPVADLEHGPQLSTNQYIAFAKRLSDALDHTSSDDFEALDLDERKIRTALQQHVPIREDRATYLADALGTNIDDILAKSPTPEDIARERRLNAYIQRIVASATNVDEKDLEDIMDYIEYKTQFKDGKMIVTKSKKQ